MNRESFLDTVSKQYVNEIHSAYTECETEQGRKVDYGRLNQRFEATD